MARYEITGPDGARYEITAPDDASEADVMRVFQSQQPKTGMLEAGARGAIQGLTFGFGDELYGAGRGAFSWLKGEGFSDEYARSRDEARAANKRAAGDNPIAYYGGEIAGSVAVPFGAARAGAAAAARLPGGIVEPVAAAGRAAGFGQLSANAGASLGARTVAGAREGAAYGALYGFGQGEGSAQDRAINSASSAAVAAPFGAAAPALVDVAGSLVRGATNPLRAAMQPRKVGQEKLAEALLRDTTGETTGPSVRNAFNRLSDRMQAGDDAGKRLMIADVGGENTRNLLRAAANQQSTGAERLRKTLDTRQAGQWARIERDIGETLGDGRSFYESVDNLVQARKANAKPAFDQAYNAPWNVKADDPLAKFLTDRGYMRRVVEKTMESVEGMTGANPAQMRPWEFLHRVKMELDREISRLKRGQQDSKANWTLRDLVDLKNEFKGHIDTHNKAFGRALSRYGDDSSLINSAEEGFETALTAPVEELRKTLQKMGQQEAEMFRIGGARAIIDKVRQGNVTRDRTENVFSSPDIQMRLRALMPDNQSFRELQKRLVLEAKMSDTRKAVQGNSTTAKQLAQADEAGQAARPVVAAAQAATGRYEPMFSYLSRQAQRFSGITPSSANAIIEAAMQRDPQTIRRALQQAIRDAGNVADGRARLAQQLIAGASASGADEPSPLRVPIGGPSP